MHDDALITDTRKYLSRRKTYSDVSMRARPLDCMKLETV